MRNIRPAIALAFAATLTLSASAAVAETTSQKADRANNGPTADIADADNLLLKKNARLMRTEDGLGISMELITTEACAYKYPDTIPAERQAQPEDFTGWAFIFNHPENCVSFPDTAFPCGPDDFNDSVKAGVYNFAGHINSVSQSSGGDLVANIVNDGMLVLTGDISTGQDNHSGPPGTTTFALENPLGAEVHVAIAPHGQIDPAELPGELYRPAGSPACDCWWVATFASPA